MIRSYSVRAALLSPGSSVDSADAPFPPTEYHEPAQSGSVPVFPSW